MHTRMSLRDLRVCKYNGVTCEYASTTTCEYRFLQASCHMLLALHLRQLHVALNLTLVVGIRRAYVHVASAGAYINYGFRRILRALLDAPVDRLSQRLPVAPGVTRRGPGGRSLSDKVVDQWHHDHACRALPSSESSTLLKASVIRTVKFPHRARQSLAVGATLTGCQSPVL